MVDQLNRPRAEYSNPCQVPADADQTLMFLGGEKIPAVRLEIVEPLDHAHEDINGGGRFRKRCKTSQQSPFPQLGARKVKTSYQKYLWKGRLISNGFQISPSEYDPLKEPSPLGLHLRKSPSLLDLIEMRLSQSNTASLGASPSVDPNVVSSKDFKVSNVSSYGSLNRNPKHWRKKNATAPALKASNFPASLLRIGDWKYESRYEGDLIAKCYFAKRKLVWEVLDGDLKKKIELQWSDIISLKANCPCKGPGLLTIVLGRKPLFFTETNPQPRRHIVWQASTDFTGGEASTHGMHYLHFPEGVLNKHYEKLIQCDSRLNLLSQQPNTDFHSPNFVPRTSSLKDPDELRGHGVDRLEIPKGSPVSSLQDITSPSPSQSSSSMIEQLSPLGTPHEDFSKEARSPISGIRGSDQAFIFHGTGNWELSKMPGMPTSELYNCASHPGQGVSSQETYENHLLLEKPSDSVHKLREITEILLGDTQMTEASDEKSLMKRVNSLCALLQDPEMTASKNKQVDERHLGILLSDAQMTETSMSRKDSLAELLVGLPRIASLSNFMHV